MPSGTNRREQTMRAFLSLILVLGVLLLTVWPAVRRYRQHERQTIRVAAAGEG